jgi:hypothetical protein
MVELRTDRGPGAAAHPEGEAGREVGGEVEAGPPGVGDLCLEHPEAAAEARERPQPPAAEAGEQAHRVEAGAVDRPLALAEDRVLDHGAALELHRHQAEGVVEDEAVAGRDPPVQPEIDGQHVPREIPHAPEDGRRRPRARD